ncbi:hypothetical protein K435DRAFT_964912 [Dendrothele bispora CBS 962.96]|uniref:Fungal-type protein kinase domain-containing protein n=1 Tax=Dendrothele bispora (strain CBS 962.96) TaxID=1314807 RepID=A0A4S8M998_DENBC|nr:hypothetical protein K435DRAFT_964912 [Dendrothele bispora CBS 962.96]
MTRSFSTPRRKTSASYTANTPPPSVYQRDLLARIEDEIGGQTWQFSAQEISQMLSPKMLKKEVDANSVYHFVTDYDYLVDDEFVQKAVNKMPLPSTPPLAIEPERENYPIIVEFLKKCVDNCKAAYNKAAEHQASQKKTSSRFPKLKKAGSHWWPVLKFSVYDKPTGDNVGSAEPLKPGFVGTHREPDEPSRCVWGATWGDESSQVGIDTPGEVKGNWRELINQAATYARAMTNFVPLRSFCLVIGVNHRQKTLRFLIFHRSGLSASEELSLTSVEGRRAIQQVFFSVYLWQTPEDAGFPSFTNGYEFALPTMGNLEQPLTRVKEGFYHSLCVRGRASFVLAVELVVPSLPPFDVVSSGFGRRPLYMDGRTVMSLSNLPAPTKLPPKPAPQADAPIGHGCYHVSKPDSPLIPLTIYGMSKQTSNMQVLYDKYGPFVLKFSWQTQQKRTLEPKTFSAAHVEYGTPWHIMSLEVKASNGSAVCNTSFLPAPSKADAAFWPLYGVPQEYPEYRSLWLTIHLGGGQTLEECDSAWDLCECLLQVAFDWLAYYAEGYLHRDISVGIVKLKKGPQLRKEFSTRFVRSLLNLDVEETHASGTNAGSSEDPSGSVDERMSQLKIGDKFWEDTIAALKTKAPSGEEDQAAVTKYERQSAVIDMARQLEDTAEDLGVTSECKAYLSDCDMVAALKKYFDDNAHNGSLSGTAEFMNVPLREAMDERSPYLQSPVDDMHSLFWTALWCVLFNTKDRGQTSKEKQWRNHLQGSNEEREAAMSFILKRGTRKEYSPMLRTMTPLFVQWRSSLDSLDQQWEPAWESVDQGEADEKLLVFHDFAFRGILGFAKLIAEHRPRLMNSY